MDDNIRLLFLLVLKLSLPVIYSEPVGTCPELDNLYTDFLTDSEDCSLFYKCKWGTPMLYECPDGLYFNPVLNVCDYPINVNCNGEESVESDDSEETTNTIEITAEPNETTESVESAESSESEHHGNPIGDCPAVDGEYATLLPHDSDCSNFFICSNGIAVLMSCPAGLHFNPNLNACNHPESAGCDSSGQEDESNEVTTRPEEESTEAEEEVTEPDESVQVTEPEEEITESAEVSTEPDDSGEVTEEIPTEPTESEETTESSEDPSEPGDFGETSESDNEGNPIGECPVVDGEYATLLPHESDCGQYFTCSNGVAILMSCPAGLDFNPILTVCDYPQNAGCGSIGGEDESNEITEPEEEPTEAEEEVTEPDESVQVTEPEEEITEPAEESTEPDDSGEVTEEIPTEPTESEETTESSEDPSEPSDSDETTESDNIGNPIGECPAVDGEYATLLPHDSDCGQYFACSNGVSILMSCPAGLHFNPTLTVCDYPQNTGCGSTGGEDESNEITEPEEESTEPEDATEPDESVQATEPDEEITEPAEESTEPDDSGEVTEEIPTEPIESEETTESSEDPSEPGDSGETTESDNIGNPIGECPAVDGEYATLLPHDSDCGQYFACSNGVAILMSCPAGLHFNPTLTVCDYPQNAGCGSTGGEDESNEITESEEESTEPGEESTELDESEEITEPEEIPTEPTESEETTESSEDPSEPADSDETTEADNEGNPIGECPVVDREYATLLPHESDCGQYFACSNGVAILMSCPAGLHFNPILTVCDYPQNAGCGSTGGEDESNEITEPEEESTELEEEATEPEESVQVTDPDEEITEPAEESTEPDDSGEVTEEIPTEPTESEETTESLEDPSEPSDSDETTEFDNIGNPIGECPAVDGEYATLLPLDSDCGQYFACSNGVAILMSCPAGLHFNPTLTVCDYPQNAGCGSIGGEDESNDITEPEEESTEPEEEVTEPDESVQVTEPEEEITESAEVSTEPDDLGEVTEEIPTEPTESEETTESSEDPSEPGDSDETTESDNVGNPIGECPAVDGEYATLLPHDSDCGQYFACSNGVTILMSCPAGLHFNPTLTVCDYPQNAECGSIGGEDESNEITEPEDEPTEAEEEVTEPDESVQVTEPEEEITEPAEESTEPDDSGEVTEPGEDTTEKEEESTERDESREVTEPEEIFTEQSTIKDIIEPSEVPLDPGDSDETTESDKEGNPVGECPVIYGEYATLLPHESNCGQYFACSNGVAILMSCPAGLHFNPTLSVCDYPQNAGCGSTGGEDESNEIIESEEESTEPGEESTELDESEEVIEPEEIPTEPTESEETTESSEDPSEPADSDETTEADHEGNPIGECPVVDGEYATLLPHDSDCGQYFACSNGVAILMSCPAGLHFNPTLTVCDYPQNAECGSTSGEDESDEITEPEEGSTELEEEVTEPDELVQVTESDEEITEPAEESTEPDDSGEVTEKIPTEPTESEETTESSEDPSEPGDSDETTESDNVGNPIGECHAADGEYATLLPHDSDCGQYFACSNGVAILMSCPAGLHFNPTLTVCDYPQNAGCGSIGGEDESNEITEPEEESTKPEEEVTEPDESVQVTEPEEEITESAEVSTEPDDLGEVTEEIPTEPTESEETTESSEDPSEPGDSDETTESDNVGNPIGECPTVDGEYATLLPHDSDCGQYIACSNGVAILMSCPAGLHFNPTLTVCDYPQNAGCGSTGEEDESNDITEPEQESTEPEEEATEPDESVQVTEPEEEITQPAEQSTEPVDSGEVTEPEEEMTEPEEESTEPEEVPTQPNESEATTEYINTSGDLETTTEDSNDINSPLGVCPEVDDLFATLLPHSSDCSKFYVCSNGVPILMNCLEGLHFNTILEVCDFPSNAGCNFSDNSDSEEVSDSAETSTELNESEEITEVPIESNESTEANESGEVTTESEESEETTKPDEISTTPSFGETESCDSVECPAVNDDYVTFVPLSSDCTKYCICDWGIAYEMYCPTGQYFNPTLNVCDWPQNSGCGLLN